MHPETGLLEDTVIATWKLRSRSRTDQEGLTAYRATKRALEHNIPASPPASLPRQSTVGTFPYPRRWPGRNSVRRVAAYLVMVLLVLYGAAFCLQNSTHCLRYGILELASSSRTSPAHARECPRWTECGALA